MIISSKGNLASMQKNYQSESQIFWMGQWEEQIRDYHHGEWSLISLLTYLNEVLMRSLVSGWPLNAIAGSLRKRSHGEGSWSEKVIIGEFLEAFQLVFWILWSIVNGVSADFSHTCSFYRQEDFCGVSFVVWRFLRPSRSISSCPSSKKRFFGSRGQLPSPFEFIFHTLVLFIARETSVEFILLFEAFWNQAMHDFATAVQRNHFFEQQWVNSKNLNNLEHINHVLTGCQVVLEMICISKVVFFFLILFRIVKSDRDEFS